MASSFVTLPSSRSSGGGVNHRVTINLARSRPSGIFCTLVLSASCDTPAARSGCFPRGGPFSFAQFAQPDSPHAVFMSFPIRMVVLGIANMLGIVMPIDFESRASLHKGLGRPATTGRLRYLLRHFMLIPPTERRSYTIMVGETTYRPAEIEALFKQLGHSDEAVRQEGQRRPRSPNQPIRSK